MTEYFNRASEKEKRRTLRRSMPKAEAILWSRLRNGQLCGLKFRRQYSIGPYVLDFYCPSQRLAVELDGDTHNAQLQYDAQRQAYIEQFGIRVIRFTNADVYGNPEGVLNEIQKIVGVTAEGEPPSIPPS